MKFIRDINVANKRVLVRVDFNVSLKKNGDILDDFKIRATLPTIEYLINGNAKIILISHLKDPAKGERFSLQPVADRLAELIGQTVKFVGDCIGEEAKQAAINLKNGEILLLENLRFYEEEKRNDAEFAAKLAALGEIFVNDAFAECHRDYTSMTAIVKLLPNYAGLLLEAEINNLTKIRDQAERPLCVIIGGAKISTKIKLVKSFLNKADDIILGGALANTVLHAKGIAVGKSIIEEAMVPEIQQLEITDTRLHLPVDALWCRDKNDFASCHCGPIGLMQNSDAIYDIGFDTEKLFTSVIKAAKTIIWNGPMGLFEIEFLARGTRAVAETIAQSQAFSVVGGGETVTYLAEIGLADKFSFISTGGGAMMEFLAGEKLPGIEALEIKN